MPRDLDGIVSALRQIEVQVSKSSEDSDLSFIVYLVEMARIASHDPPLSELERKKSEARMLLEKTIKDVERLKELLAALPDEALEAETDRPQSIPT